ncbi:hypothetical protein LTR37_010484 [Vermiconidia calcicola]|uniref:Uncharacterized protein n=1 Tax=Vermiconidia calcicola TaxID=1690605 RepID=A0ACC3N5B3_9PEZI|nr:hypothetical protein LTR37_010484 [Vermiconidia calcicola]
MAEKKHVCIAGAGVAGPALALLLTRAGHRATIIERAPELRASGQQIDVSGEGLEVIKRMGVDEAIRSSTVEDAGLKIVDADDRVIAAFPASGTGSAEVLVKEVEIMRTALVNILYQNTSEVVEYIYDEYITEIRQHDSGATVSFAKAQNDREFDLVITADGLGSRTRRLAFDPSNTRIVGLGQYATFVSIPWQKSDTTWSRGYNATNGRVVSIRPDVNNGTSSAYLAQATKDSSNIAKLLREEQKQKILEIFKDAGWETERVLQNIEKNDSDFYLQETAQAFSKSWSNGRVVLLGDAGYCPSPVSGQGTTIALIGAYILAGCIATYTDYREAFRQYEIQMRPFVDSAQKLPPGTPWIICPQTELGIAVLRNVAWVAGLANSCGVFSFLGNIANMLPAWGSKEPKLPVFPALQDQELERKDQSRVT